jgi:hypothetical protein
MCKFNYYCVPNHLGSTIFQAIGSIKPARASAPASITTGEEKIVLFRPFTNNIPFPSDPSNRW